MNKPIDAARKGTTSAWGFLKAFVDAPGIVGAVAPTSRGVSRRIAELAGIEKASLVAELGAGTGAITGELLKALPDDGRLWAYEIHPPFVEDLRQTITDPRATILDEPAQTLDKLMERENLPGFDAVVSALPFSLMGHELTDEVLRVVARSLCPGGVFVALQYHPLFLAPHLRATFMSVDRGLYPWNIPPAHLLRARNPREGM